MMKYYEMNFNEENVSCLSLLEELVSCKKQLSTTQGHNLP